MTFIAEAGISEHLSAPLGRHLGRGKLHTGVGYSWGASRYIPPAEYHWQMLQRSPAVTQFLFFSEVSL